MLNVLYLFCFVCIGIILGQKIEETQTIVLKFHIDEKTKTAIAHTVIKAKENDTFNIIIEEPGPLRITCRDNKPPYDLLNINYEYKPDTKTNIIQLPPITKDMYIKWQCYVLNDSGKQIMQMKIAVIPADRGSPVSLPRNHGQVEEPQSIELKFTEDDNKSVSITYDIIRAKENEPFDIIIQQFKASVINCFDYERPHTKFNVNYIYYPDTKRSIIRIPRVTKAMNTKWRCNVLDDFRHQSFLLFYFQVICPDMGENHSQGEEPPSKYLKFIANEIIRAKENEPFNIIIGKSKVSFITCRDNKPPHDLFNINYIYKPDNKTSIIQMPRVTKYMYTEWYCIVLDDSSKSEIQIKFNVIPADRGVPRNDSHEYMISSIYTHPTGSTSEETSNKVTTPYLFKDNKTTEVITSKPVEDANSTYYSTEDKLEGGTIYIVAVMVPLALLILSIIIFFILYYKTTKKRERCNELQNNSASEGSGSPSKLPEIELETYSEVTGSPQTIIYASLCDELMYSRPLKVSQRQIKESEPTYVIPAVY